MSIIVPAQGGELLSGGGVLKVRGEQTGGALDVVDVILGPKQLIPHHVHENDIWIYASKAR